ncbi:MAG TPA: hypothetical protein VF068_05280 [Rubrobacter sp.]
MLLFVPFFLSLKVVPSMVLAAIASEKPTMTFEPGVARLAPSLGLTFVMVGAIASVTVICTVAASLLVLPSEAR